MVFGRNRFPVKVLILPSLIPSSLLFLYTDWVFDLYYTHSLNVSCMVNEFHQFLFQKIFIFFLNSGFLQIRLVISEFPGSVVWSLPLIWGKICRFKFSLFLSVSSTDITVCTYVIPFVIVPSVLVFFFFSVFAYLSNIGVAVCPLFSSLSWIQEELLIFQSVQLLLSGWSGDFL